MKSTQQERNDKKLLNRFKKLESLGKRLDLAINRGENTMRIVNKALIEAEKSGYVQNYLDCLRRAN